MTVTLTSIETRTQAKPIEWAKAACDALIAKFPNPADLPPANRWHYHQGIFLYGMIKVWEKLGNDEYITYPKGYADALIDPYGGLLFARDELDSIMPGLLLLALHDRYGDNESRYAKASEKLRQLFNTLNRTSKNGFWHKDKYPYQMWLDGLYMGGVFALQYAKRFDDEALVDMVVYQEHLMRKYMHDDRTGLLFHAWDETRRAPWANDLTGCSPEFWGRSLGWYGMAVADFLDELPEQHSARKELTAVLGAFSHALIRYQDKASGLWYQVVDKGDRPDNWLETSCTSLFVYTIAKAYKHGAVGEDALQAAREGYEGLLQRLRFDDAGHLIVPEICIGTSAGDYQNYVTRPVSENDLHGVGAFVLACAEMEDLY
jgi:unsaturated rhamnogalacturonyl hydrolase